MPERLMIDSGAFSVWNAGKTIDLDEYIRWCKQRPNVNVYVGLDVIPPKTVKHLTAEVKEKVASEGWNNYLKMIRHLPMDKVVPVYHRGDHVKWLETFLDFGCPYIGLSPRFDGSPMERRHKFVNDAKPYIYDSEGNPTVKVHGFAVTNHQMMTNFKWYSVDSATWTQVAAWGGILVPALRGDKWDFTKAPYRVFCSVIAMKRQAAEHHLLAMMEQRPQLYEIVRRWLKENGVGIGRHRIEPANGRKPKALVERWADRAKTKILKITQRGVTNCDQIRRWLNAVYYHHCNDALGMNNIYLAGSGPSPPIEAQIRYRLRSFAEDSRITDWFYRRIGTYSTPLEFPFDKPLNFSWTDDAIEEPTSAAE